MVVELGCLTVVLVDEDVVRDFDGGRQLYLYLYGCDTYPRNGRPSLRLSSKRLEVTVRSGLMGGRFVTIGTDRPSQLAPVPQSDDAMSKTGDVQKLPLWKFT